MEKFPDYYKVLGVQESATAEEIRTAYKRESLRTHPDRFPNASAFEKKQKTERFQALSDAFYVLSDPGRRREYDDIRANQPRSAFEDFDPTSDPASAWQFFSGLFGSTAAAGASSSAEGGRPDAREPEPDANTVFGDVFEELLRPEVQRVVPVWKWVGTAAGGALGFILANVPGAIGGSVLGNRMGAIRDAKGKSVAQVFVNLEAGQRAEILKALALKVLGSITS